ncbi:YTH domain-containing protein ECT3-like isoform X2 [Phragmites australis]|uniref:YTH domain-containing protein ECT3-like isoform X2 n=1 Tax=Phragmites australis TaxID=29695 RepID=UPI002D77727D|nr:YTH domain-containing protein ECT3-like isoform X2 [Phragmites australis]
MVPPESQAAVEKNSSMSVETKEQLVSSKGHKISSTTVHGASSLKLPKSAQEEASFMGEGGEQQFGYHPNAHALQPQTLFSGGYLNHLGTWEEYPHVVSAEGLDAASPVMYGAYSPPSTIGDSQWYFPLLYPLSNPYYQPPASPSIGYSNSAIGISQFDPMHQYYLPDTLLYPPTPDFHQPFGSLDGAPMQPSGIPGLFGQGNIPLTSKMESMYSSGSYKVLQQGGKFGGATPRCSAASSRFSTFNKGFKHEKSSLDFLNEQNRGPRATKTQKEVESSSAEDKNKTTLLIVDSEQYNHPDFLTEYKDAKFFVIKSYTEDHVHKSIKYNVWASTSSGNRKLNVAYHEAKEKEDHCPIFLFFSVNGSGQFCGVAEMIGPVNFDKSVDYWQNDRWSGQFPVKWHIVKDAPNNLVRHIILENNENKPVTNSRDTQEVKLEQGLQMLAIFKNHEAQTTILEDFDFYEQREKAMLDNRQQEKLQCANAEARKLVEASAPVNLMTHISATFARAVQLEETKGKENRTKVEDTTAAERHKREAF